MKCRPTNSNGNGSMEMALDQKHFLHGPVSTSMELPSAYCSLWLLILVGAQPLFTVHSWSAAALAAASLIVLPRAPTQLQ